MAKKSANQLLILACSICKNQNYTTTRNTTNIKEKLSLSKFCKHCRKHTEHNEIKI